MRREGTSVARGSGEPEVENFDDAVFGQDEIGGLDVAMNDAAGVGGVEAARDLQCDVHGRAKPHIPASDELVECFASVERHRDERIALRCLANLEDGADVDVVEGRRGARLLQEPVADDVIGRELEGDVAVQIHVVRPIDDAHSAFAELVEHL